MSHDPASGQSLPLDQRSFHLVFESGYVELSVLSSQSAAHHLAPYAGRYRGLHILALGVSDVAAAARRVRMAGISITEPTVAAREVEYGSRAGTAKFRWFMLTPAGAPEALICFVQHLTPDIVFQAEVQRHPNTATALTEATFVVADPVRTSRLLSVIADTDAVEGPGGWRLDLGRTGVRIATAAQFAASFPGASVPSLPSMGAMRLEVSDVSTAVHHCQTAGVPVHLSQSRAWVDARFGAGAVIEFVQTCASTSNTTSASLAPDQPVAPAREN